jgi:hypothetical protein
LELLPFENLWRDQHGFADGRYRWGGFLKDTSAFVAQCNRSIWI